MGLAFVPLYIKYLGIEAYGVIGLFAVLQAWLGLLDMGMTPTLVREMARFTGGTHSNESIRDLLRSIEIIAWGMAVLIAGGVALGSGWIATSWLKADALPVGVVAQAFVIMGLVTALRFVESVYRSALVGLQRQVLLNVVNCVLATLRGVGAVGILVWVSPTIGAFFLWQAIISIVTLTALCISTYSIIPKGIRCGIFSLDALREIWTFAGGIFGTTFLAAILTQTDKIILSGILDLKSWGYYSFATAISGSLSLLSTPIHQAWSPLLSEIASVRDKKKFIYNFHLGSQITTVIIGSISLVAIFYAEVILHLWTQNKDLSESVYKILQVLLFGKMLNCLLIIPSVAQLAYGWTSLGFKSNIFAVIILVPSLVLIVPKYSSIGAAWIWVALNIGYFVFFIPAMFSKIIKTEKWAWYFHDVLSPVALSFFALLIFRLLFAGDGPLLVDFLTLLAAMFVAFFASIMGSSILRTYIIRYIQILNNGIFK